MIIHDDSDEYETKVETRTCAFHKKNPCVPYAGCTCSGSWSRVKKSPDEKPV